jgi:hypothetical protein
VLEGHEREHAAVDLGEPVIRWTHPLEVEQGDPTGGVRNEVCRVTATRRANHNSVGCSSCPWPSTARSSPDTTGATKGRTIRVISIQSSRKPSTNTRSRIRTRVPWGPTARSPRAVAMSRSPPNSRSTSANTVAPTKMAKI